MVRIENNKIIVQYVVGDYVRLGTISYQPDIAIENGYVKACNGTIYIKDDLGANFEDDEDKIVRIMDVKSIDNSNTELDT